MIKPNKKITKKRNSVSNITNKKSLKNLTHCSPRSNNETYTCLTKPSLKRIISNWNNYYSNDIIYLTGNESRFDLWKKINSKLSKICDNDYCWLKQPFMNEANSVMKEFKPSMPASWQQNKNEWLTTSNIDSVMKQYMSKHPDFFFVGAVPIDFDSKLSPGVCVVNELCKIKINNLLKKGLHKLGVVFNLDPHNKPGSHWVSFFADFKTGKILYFDSYGFKAPSQIKTFANRLITQGSSNSIPMRYLENKRRHQFKDSECGIYSIYFIESMLNGKNFNRFCNSNIPDEVMERLRYKYFVKY